MDELLRDKVAVVTGGASDIGEGIVRRAGESPGSTARRFYEPAAAPAPRPTEHGSPS